MRIANLLIILSIFLMACESSSPDTVTASNAEAVSIDNDKMSKPVSAVGVDKAGEESPYAVGSYTTFIHDASRPYDNVAGVNVGQRSMITEVWYPVDHGVATSGAYKKATYGDYVFRDEQVHHLMMTQTTFFHLTPEYVNEGVNQEQIDAGISELFDRPRQSFINAPLAASTSPWPVVVMTHGDAGSRYNMESACEYLAANGYVVIAPEHTGNSPFSFTGKDPTLETSMVDVKPFLNADGTYGSKENFGQTYTPLIRDRSDPQALVNLDNSLLQRVNDLRATLTELDAMNEDGRFSGKLDLDRIGLMGRSFGGTTTLAGLALEDRFTAGVAVVPLLMPDVRTGLPKEMLKATESVILNAQGPSAISEINKPTMLLSGAEDSLIIGVGAEVAKTSGGTLPTPNNPLPPLRAAYEKSNAPVFWGLLKDSNHSSFGVSGGYWWPQLKPNTQARYFDQNDVFTLIKPEIAHNIQKQKVLEFFEVMIKQDDAARTKLIENQFVEQGLIYESRNF